MKNCTITFLFLMVGIFAFAQTSYEYAVVSYAFENSATKGMLTTSTVDKYEEKIVRIDKGIIYTNYSELLKTIENMTNNGWEVVGITSTNSGTATSYHLRKKKN